ncbi:MAG TPA: site-2 protease family protein [Elusimicrobia bacterium]|nr:site-2 protease family protein [Elusimicrobiota bacterium]
MCGVEWILQLPVLFFSVVIHEFSHGYAAWRHGDDTAEKQGRLTLNPFAHVDPFGTVFLPLVCFFLHAPMFGWAKPVPVNASRLNDPQRDLMRVAFAGPASNLALALGGALLFKAAMLFPAIPPDYRKTLLEALLFGVSVNLILAFFNLVPVFPLDGSRILGGLLPKPWRKTYYRHIPYGTVIILLLVFTKAFGTLVLFPSQLVLSGFARIGLIG